MLLAWMLCGRDCTADASWLCATSAHSRQHSHTDRPLLNSRKARAAAFPRCCCSGDAHPVPLGQGRKNAAAG
jgi:hypothetical protein